VVIRLGPQNSLKKSRDSHQLGQDGCLTSIVSGCGVTANGIQGIFLKELIEEVLDGFTKTIQAKEDCR